MGITIFFPVYNDENTVERVTMKSIEVLQKLVNDYEVLIINDGSPDRAGEIADEIARKHPDFVRVIHAGEIADEIARKHPDFVRVIHHDSNKGYGVSVREGLRHAKYDWVCFTDGDDEYDVYDLLKMYPLRRYYSLIITFRYVKRYSGLRQFISLVYNIILRRLYRTRFRDISTGLRLIYKPVLEDIELESTSPFIGAEIAIKTMLRGHPVGEMGIQTFPRVFGKSSSTSLKNIMATIRDMITIYRKIFSEKYELPHNR